MAELPVVLRMDIDYTGVIMYALSLRVLSSDLDLSLPFFIPFALSHNYSTWEQRFMYPDVMLFPRGFSVSPNAKVYARSK